MINTLNHSSHLLTKLLIVAALVYGVKNREEISHSVRDFLARNATVQETTSSLKWLKKELFPTEAEKAHRKAYGEEQRKRAAELRALGVNPTIQYVGPENKKEYQEAAAFIRKLHEDVNR